MPRQEQSNPFQYPTIARERRELMLRVWAGHKPHNAITTTLHHLDCHFPPDKLDYAYRWLIANKITGKAFEDFIVGECGGSRLLVHRRLLEAITKSAVVKIIHGKDFL